MGLTWWEEGGGENHPDGVVFDQSLWVGDLQITDEGRFVGPPRLKKLYDSMSRRMDSGGFVVLVQDVCQHGPELIHQLARTEVVVREGPLHTQPFQQRGDGQGPNRKNALNT